MALPILWISDGLENLMSLCAENSNEWPSGSFFYIVGGDILLPTSQKRMHELCQGLPLVLDSAKIAVRLSSWKNEEEKKELEMLYHYGMCEAVSTQDFAP